jgi:hypothetical protein
MKEKPKSSLIPFGNISNITLRKRREDSRTTIEAFVDRSVEPAERT